MWLGLLCQIMGIFTISISQVIFWYKARKKYGGIRKAFLFMSFPRYAPKEEEVRKASEAELEEYLERFPLAGWLFDNFESSIIGLIFTLIGAILSSLSI